MTKVYQTGGLKQRALDKVSINFRESEFVAILGPSGSGKTTLLNIIGGLDHYTNGDLTINEISTKKFRDKDWDSYRNHRVGFVFQSYNLIPHQTILANVRLALTLSGISKKESIRRAKKALKEVGLGEHIDKRPAQLSGGQMQRVAIARALVNDPDILLADEPTGALDSETSVQIMDLLKGIAENKLVIMVTHNPELAEEYATRIISLKDGKITSDSDPYDGSEKTDLNTHEAKKKSKKTRMSFFTALSLSLQNLLTKKARTILVAMAGSIGIIGIALISAVSTGFQNYIDYVEKETLISTPLTLNKKSTDLSGILLNMTGDGGGENNGSGKIKENQVITSMLGNVSENDLKSFRHYLDQHQDETKKDIRLIENIYSVDPLIYTEDKTGKIAKSNPSDLFSSVFGGSAVMSNYTTMTSVFQQNEIENIKENSRVVAGRYPEKYNELVVFLSNPEQVSDLLTYALGFHDSEAFSQTVTKVLGGEKAELKTEPLEISYEDFLNLDLRLIKATDTYKYNEKYEVYEDMSDDENYMKDLYENKSEKLKIVGIVTPEDSSFSLGNGVFYQPELIRHIIDEAKNTEIVKKQLANPEIDIFSNKKFGEKKDGFNFEFSDLVSVDEVALSQAFGSKLDQNAVSNKTKEYMSQISDQLTADVSPIKNVLIDKYKTLAEGLKNQIAGLAGTGTFKASDITPIVNDFLAKQDFSDLEKLYLPKDQAVQLYTGLLTTLLGSYAGEFPSEEIPIVPIAYGKIVEGSLKMTEFDAVFEKVAVPLTEVKMKQTVLSQIGGLTAYLSNSFANAFSVDQEQIINAFHLNFSEEELSRVVSAMFNKQESTLDSNFALLGYQDLESPTRMAFYFNSFEGKTHFTEFLNNYNDEMHKVAEDKVIEYTDTAGTLISSVKVIVDAVSYVLIAFVSISLVVSSIMIGVITYISVYERTKEIGILRAMGASKRNISSIFNAETMIIGFLSGIFGVGVSYLLIPIINFVLHQFIGDIPLYATLDPRTALGLVLLSVVLTLIGGLIPAKKASLRDPVEALRSE